jgi:hypothetical protein
VSITISHSLLKTIGDDDTKVATNSNEEAAVATSSNDDIKGVDTNSNDMINKKEGV